MTRIPNDTQAILLLTAHLSRPVRGDPEPLTITEWNSFSKWLKDKDLQTGDLLTEDVGKILRGWQSEKCPIERIQSLLSRGTALALALEKWTRVGVWVLEYSDVDYPRLLKERLKELPPPLLFCCGNRRLLNSNGIGVVGSRDAGNQDLEFARAFGKKLADSGMSVISGGARGVDEAAMLSALEKDGTVVGVLADGLFRAVISQKYRASLKRQNLVLMSSFCPDAGFNVGNAMARNKYIYCLSDATVVVHSGTTGGTWNGALETLKKGWVPLWVRKTTDRHSGNRLIVQNGGRWLPDDVLETDLNSLFARRNTAQESIERRFGEQVAEDVSAYQSAARERLASKPLGSAETDSLQDKSLYEIFCMKLKQMLAQESVSLAEIHKEFGLTENQAKIWLKQAADSGLIIKLNKPLRYELAAKRKKQMSLFENE